MADERQIYERMDALEGQLSKVGTLEKTVKGHDDALERPRVFDRSIYFVDEQNLSGTAHKVPSHDAAGEKLYPAFLHEIADLVEVDQPDGTVLVCGPGQTKVKLDNA